MIEAAIFAGPFSIGVSGYILKDSPVKSLVNSIRVVARCGRAISPELAAIARQAEEDPLTSREREILRLVEQGQPNSYCREVESVSRNRAQLLVGSCFEAG